MLTEEDFNLKFRSLLAKFVLDYNQNETNNPILVEKNNETNFDLFIYMSETKKSPNLFSLANMRLLLMACFVGNFYKKK